MYDIEEVKQSFDEIVKKFKYELDIQYSKGRLKGTEYADTYKALMDRAMQLAWQTPTLAADVKIKEQQYLNLLKENSLLDCQINKCDAETDKINSDRQINENKAIKELAILDAQIDKLDCEIRFCEAQITKLNQDTVNEDEAHDKNMLIADKELEYKTAQIAFTERQTQGFDENIQQKMLEIQMNSWAMMFSSGLLEEKPTIITNDEVSDLYCHMKQNAGVGPC